MEAEKLFESLHDSINKNNELFSELRKIFTNSMQKKSDIWHHDWTLYFDEIENNLITLNSIHQISKSNEYVLALNGLRQVLENIFFVKLYIDGKKAHGYRVFRITPSSHQNPEARDITLSKWSSELKTWKKTQDPALKRYENILEVAKIGNDQIRIKIFIDGVYESKDVEKKGHWITYYQQIFDDYDPLNHFVDHLSSIKEGTMFSPDEDRIAAARMVYNRHFNFEVFLDAWELNNFMTSSQEQRFRVHYNFLSLFVHPNVLPRRIISYQHNPSGLKSIQQSQTLNLLILLYIVKFQALLLSAIMHRSDSIADLGLIAKQLALRLEENSTSADLLWFVFDEPTSWDVHQAEQLARWKEKKEVVVGYYRDPLERLKQMGF